MSLSPCPSKPPSGDWPACPGYPGEAGGVDAAGFAVDAFEGWYRGTGGFPPAAGGRNPAGLESKAPVMGFAATVPPGEAPEELACPRDSPEVTEEAGGVDAAGFAVDAFEGWYRGTGGFPPAWGGMKSEVDIWRAS